MKLIRTRLGDHVKLAGCGVTELRVKLIGQEVELRYGILNHRLGVACHIHTVVVYTINGEAVVTGTITTDGATFTSNSSRHGSRVGESDGEVQNVTTQH